MRNAGFSLIELAVVVLVIGLLLGSLLVPLNAQLQQRRITETRDRMTEAREALVSYVMTNGRFPCPATDASNGQEKFVPSTGNPTNGSCEWWNGFLPAATLGMTNLDGNGYATDAWANPANRIRYAVSNVAVPIGNNNPFTKTGGMRVATLTELARVPGTYKYLSVCSSAQGINATDCGSDPGTVKLADGNAVAVLYSLGRNAAEVLSGALTPTADEAVNSSVSTTKRVLVSRPSSDVSGSAFDDTVEWIGVYETVGKLVKTGLLP